MQIVLAQPKLHIQGTECGSSFALLFLALFWHCVRGLKRFRLAQQREPFQALAQHGVIYLPRAVQPDA